PSRSVDLGSGRSPADASRSLQGDLDHIVLTAMRKRPSRRYSSVAALSRDVTAYLTGHPLHTRTYTRFDRVGKFARRHKAAVAGALLIILVLLCLAVAMAMHKRGASQRLASQASAVFRCWNPAVGRGCKLGAMAVASNASRTLRLQGKAIPD
ncbi:MAG TPA: hypothetical protein VNA86_13345, partial [bacterium]|nr:hypothetical protein [bacterium]